MVSPKIQAVVEHAIRFVVAFWLGVASLVFLLLKVVKNGFGVLKIQMRTTPPPILMDEKWGTHQYMLLKGQNLKLHYVEKGDKKNPLLLCLHGFPECWFSWRHQLVEFSSQFWVVAVDMRGYGDSDKPPRISDYALDLLVEDVREFILDTGHTRCSLMAHDWGAVVAWRLVGRHPSLFERHISLNGPEQRVYGQALRTSFQQFLKSWYVFFFQCPVLPELLLSLNDFEPLQKLFRGPKELVEAFPNDVIEAYKYYAAKEGRLRWPINYYRNIAGEVPTPAPRDGEVSVPTLIVWGTEDVALSKDIAHRMTRLCSDVQLKMVEGAGHFVHEEEPRLVNDLVWDYIRITK